MIYLRPQVHRFVILFVGRTGSTYLQRLLDDHPSVRALGETLGDLREKGAEAQLEWVRWALSPPLLGHNRALGFKTKLVDVLDSMRFAKLLGHNGCRIIHMRRRNRIKAVVSHMNAVRLWEATDRWNLYEEKDRLPPFAIDPEQFKRRLEARVQVEMELDEFVGSLRLATHPLYYEELLQCEHATLGRVFNFLGVQSRQVRSDTLKNTSDDLRRQITNFDQLRSHFVDTPYEAMFDEVLVAGESGVEKGARRP